MSPKPQWLDAFPFIKANWQHIEALSHRWSGVSDYELSTDWQAFIHEHQDWDDFRILRQFRSSRLAWLAFQDISQPMAHHVKTLHAVSALADWLVQQACALSEEWMQGRHGQVRDESGQAMQLMVFALGKLGTCELNYSSDIDLVFIYPDNGCSDGDKPLDAERYFTRMGQRIIKLLDHVTRDGRVYQVDMRLRPFGSAAPLVCSAAALHLYLVNEGRNWERFAWMRGRAICGESSECEQVQQQVNAFIYRRHLDYTVFSALARIKADITREMQVDVNDLKMGEGGIRQIEFIIQSLQMVFGGRNPELQGVSIYPQIQQLNKAGQLSAEDCQRLTQAWLWLRKTENACQMMADQATHVLPDDPQQREDLARAMGLAGAAELEQTLQAHRSQVQQIFTAMFSDPDDKQSLDTSQQQQLSGLLADINFSRMSSDAAAKVRELLEKTVTMTDAQTQQLFVQLVRAISKRPGYLIMLLKESGIHAQVLSLLSGDPYFSQVLIQYPMLLEQLFDSQPAIHLDQQAHSTQWKAPPAADEEQWMEQLRAFKLQQQFNLMRAHQDGSLDSKQLHQGLTSLAAFIVRQVVYRSWQETQLKLPCASIQASELMVIAYGSMALRQMHIHSDLDLVFVLDKTELDSAGRQFTQRWIRRLTHHLISPMYHGLLYEIDLQLRPNGNSGTLVTTRAEFERYQRQEAWIWEHAAMVKSRLVVGDQAQKQWHAAFRHAVLSQQRDPRQVDQALREMADKMASLPGSKAHDDEFAVLGGVLKHAHDHPQLTAVSDLGSLRRQLIELNLLQA
jgi:glutamate-ammonia-ligase adenylyltransferase